MKQKINNQCREINQQLIQLFSAFDDAHINQVPFAGSWTPAQVAAHVIKSETFILKSMSVPGKPVDRLPDERVPELKGIFLNFTTKFQSPDFIVPEQKTYEKKELIAQLTTVSGQLYEKTDAINVSEAVIDPALGELTKLEMIHFVAYHTQRHIHQLKHIFQTINKHEIMITTNEAIVRKVNEAFNMNDMQVFLSYCTDDIEWNMVGNSATQGKEAILAMMTAMPADSPDVTITDIFSNGDKTACTGTFTMTKKTGEKEYFSFCDIYKFREEKIQVLDSYVVEIKQ